MGIAKDFNKVIHEEINVHAAWLPVTNIFAVGDFGVVSDGVLVRMGNVRSDFGVDFDTRAGPPASIDFKSEKVREIRFTAGASVDVFPTDDDEVEAKLVIEFERSKSFYLKGNLSVDMMESPMRTAQALMNKPGWNARKFKVVSATYTAPSCLLLSSKAGNTTVEIGGKAGALKRLSLGDVEAGLTFTSKSELGLEVKGGTSGVVGLDLFKASKGEVEFLSGDASPDEIELKMSADIGADLEDDF